MHDHQPFAFHKQAIVHAYTADPAGLDGWVFDNTTVAASGTGVRFDDGSTVARLGGRVERLSAAGT